MRPAFAVWITGLPASGKSTLAGTLKSQLAARGVDAEVLESDSLRKVWSDQTGYGLEERGAFYRQISEMGMRLNQRGISVIFDATANLRAYREQARREIPSFLEVYVDCPLETCIARDPKGIYRNAQEGKAQSVPGLQAPYEPPEAPDVVVHGDRDSPSDAARRVIGKLTDKGYL